MSKSAIAAVAIGTAGIIAIGVSYKYCVQPREADLAEDRAPLAKVPLTVSGVTVGDSLMAGAKVWNDAAGCKLFEVVATGGDIEIVRGALEPGEGEDGLIDAERAYARVVGGKTVGGKVELRAAVQPNTEYLAIAHGLGHIAGLAHDDFSASIMYIRVLELADSFPMPRPTDKDGAALGAEYCGAR